MSKFRSLAFLLAVFIFITVHFSQFATAEQAPAEKEALAKLRTIIKDEELNLDYMKTDSYLLSWLRRHKFDVDTTAQSIRKALKWRKDYKVDNLPSEDFSVFTKNYPFDVEGVDRQGRPVWISQIGKWDIRRITLSGLQDKYDRYILYLHELISKKMHERSEKHSDNVSYGFLVIIDLGGFNLRQHGCIQCFQESMKFDMQMDSVYPDGPYKTLLVNAPRIFNAFYRTIQSLRPDRPHDNSEVFDFDQQKWQKVLQKYMAPDQIPTQYGGTRKTNLL